MDEEPDMPVPVPDDVPSPWTLRSYSVLADGERGALLDPEGRIVWLCAPRWHSGAVFSALIGGPGHFTLEPADRWHVRGGSYEDGSLVWKSRWVDADRVIECRNALAMPATPGRLVVLRRARAVRGDALLRLGLDVRPGFGAHRLRDPRLEGGVEGRGRRAAVAAAGCPHRVVEPRKGAPRRAPAAGGRGA